LLIVVAFYQTNRQTTVALANFRAYKLCASWL